MNESVDALFEEYARARDEGREPRVPELERRAGDGRDDLRRRIEALGEIEQLAELFGTEPAAPGPREQLGRFTLLRELGRGGLSTVWLAEDPKLERRVALKVLAPQVAPSEDMHRWILNEGRSLARLEHPGIVRVFEVDEADGRAFIAMELVRGPTLARVLAHRRGEPPGDDGADGELEARARSLDPLATRVRLVARIARALAYSHAQGVLHRDVKPGNVLLTAEGPKLIDFGLAHLESAQSDGSSSRLTQTLVGTPAYIAPEQVDSGRTGADRQSDQFSLGVVLYELLAGENPFDRGRRSATLDAISRANPPRLRDENPEIARNLQRISQHCLERDPAERYPTLDALAADLEAFLELRAISLAPPGAAGLARLWVRRHAGRVAAAVAALALFAAALAGLWLRAGWRARRSLSAELEAVRGGLASLSGPGEFRDGALTNLDALRERARRLDAEPLRAAVFGARLPDVDAALWEADREIARAIAAERSESERKGYDYRLGGWRSQLDYLHVICPDCDGNEHDRLRGHVELAPELAGLERELYTWRPSAALRACALQRVPFASAPGPGLYRLVARAPATGAVRFEVEFRVSPDDPLLVLAPRPVTPELLRGMFELAVDPLEAARWSRSGSIEVEGLPPGQSYRISRGPVTWGELRGFLREHPQWEETLELSLRSSADLFPLGAKQLADERPALVWWSLADAYARWRGARLPTFTELVLALDRPDFARPPPESGVTAEWVATPVHTDLASRNFVGYDVAPGDGVDGRTLGYARETARMYAIRWPAAERRGRVGFTTFRLALSGRAGGTR